jgi:nitrite reductase (NO-forming)
MLYASEYTFGFSQSALTSPGPTLELNVGDIVTVTVTNVGSVPHAWALTTSNIDGTVLFGAAIGSSSNPLQPGQTGSDTFTVTQAGNFYYICPIPGHASLGMWGNIIINP